MVEARHRLSQYGSGPLMKAIPYGEGAHTKCDRGPGKVRKRAIMRAVSFKAKSTSSCKIVALLAIASMFGMGLFADEIKNSFLSVLVKDSHDSGLRRKAAAGRSSEEKERFFFDHKVRKQQWIKHQSSLSNSEQDRDSLSKASKEPQPLKRGKHSEAVSANTTVALLEPTSTQQPKDQTVITSKDAKQSSAASHRSLRISRSISGAQNFVARRRAGYKRAGRLDQWSFRGVGYLYVHHQMVLAAMLPEQEEIRPGRNVIQIYDVNSPERNDCHLLTIWVRVNGPEIFAGSAEAVKKPQVKTCHWEFSFDLKLPGSYTVDAKLLTWNGAVEENDPNSMPIHHGNDVPWEQYPNHVSMLGFKLYDPPHSCCEACSRTPGCVYWSAPSLHFDDKWSCEFYFNSSDTRLMAPFQHYTPDIQKVYVETELRNKTKNHGPPHSNPSSYFMGCGWNFYLTGVSQCEHPLDDSVYIANNEFRLEDSELANFQATTQETFPLCELEQHESLDGRWVREEYPTSLECPREMDDRKELFSRLKHHDLLMFQDDNPHCWFRDDLASLGTRCFVDGCGTNRKFVWRSTLSRERQWYGSWKNYACDYMELSNTELQQCFDSRKIVSMQTQGTSVAGYINEYLQQRLSYVKFFDPEATNTPKEHTLNVTIDTLSAPHLMWHNSSAEWRREFEDYPSPKPWEEHYYTEAMYFVSEREPFCTAPRAQVINRDMEEILVRKGLKKLSTFQMSSAFSYDSATQMDGMHIVGPPLRMVVTKLFHYVCKDHLTP